MFPLNKYKYYVDEKNGIVVAVQTFAKKRFSGIARCAKSDVFDVEIGKKIAALKCNKKIASARVKYAKSERDSWDRWYFEVKSRKEKYEAYLQMAVEEYNEAVDELNDALDRA